MLGDGGRVFRAWAALEEAVSHGVCRAVHTDHQVWVSNLRGGGA